MTRRLVVLVVLILAVGIGAGAYYMTREDAKPEVMTSAVTRGDVIEAVSATGALEAVTTVQVGTQVSGTIQALHADYNSIVRKGQVIARLDPSLFQTQIDQQRANLLRSESEVERLRVTAEDARTKLARAEELSQRQLIPASELETAQVNVKSAQAQVQSAQAQVTQSRASLNQAEVNLRHTVIEAPIDGIVISRNVDVGQTVAASMQAPTLFVIALDLTKMKVNANIDEADVGRIRPAQHVTFRVDAYPTEEFEGMVSQIRLQPTTVQNVVTYATVIDVPNDQLKLKPGMTANVSIQIARRTNVLRLPNMALRFRPTTDIFAALGQQPPPDFNRAGRPGGAGQPANGGAPAGEQPASGASGAPRPRGTSGDAVPVATGDAAQQAGAPRPEGDQRRPDWQNLTPEERRRRLEERMKDATPEERERMMQRTREREGAPSAQRSAPSAPSAPKAPGAPGASGASGAPRTIDALFGPLPPTQSAGRVWRYVDGKLTPVRVRLGVTDGTNTELVSGDLPEGAPVVTGVLLQPAVSSTQGGTRSPLMGPQRGGGPGGGGQRTGSAPR